MRDFLRRAWRAFDAVVLWRLRRKRDEAISRSPIVAERLYRTAAAVARLPFRSETLELPQGVQTGTVRLDVVDDLVAYTRLPRSAIERELRMRHQTSFRTEWHATPIELRQDHWFYLSSKGYLFGNAVHFPDSSFPDRFVHPFVPERGHVLDFGAGAGNLALALAGRGLSVCATELSALQRDFIRFRVARHGVGGLVAVTDWWERLPERAFDAVIAVDVLEHLPDCRSVLEEQLLPALNGSGVLVENSPFVINTSNPMHHEDFGLDEFLLNAGFALAHDGGENTRVWRRA
jgi:SAM-dependent methyltransferase